MTNGRPQAAPYGLSTPCLIHPNKPSDNGYVRLNLSRVVTYGGWVSAHRVAYEEAYGAIPEGMLVRHKCDVRNCVEPTHLELGSSVDNVKDMFERGRAPDRKGEAHAHKLTEGQVRAIRASNEPQKALASRYNVSRPVISRIKSRQIWKHI